ncbi:hypothetical protein ACFQ1S_21560, partial [Kibdelosporangium lantanae]
MGDLVDELLKRHVTPVLRDVGFKRSGANYRLVADNGDVAIADCIPAERDRSAFETPRSSPTLEVTDRCFYLCTTV